MQNVASSRFKVTLHVDDSNKSQIAQTILEKLDVDLGIARGGSIYGVPYLTVHDLKHHQSTTVTGDFTDTIKYLQIAAGEKGSNVR